MEEQAGPNMIEQMAAFNQRIGKPFVDPTRISGFGEEGDAPAPPLPPDLKPLHIPTAKELFGGDPVEAPEPPVAPTPSVLASTEELVVLESAASYKQHGVIMTSEERAAIVTVVLKALRRDLDDKFREIAGTVPRRKRTVAEPKKRGRPPKATA